MCIQIGSVMRQCTLDCIALHKIDMIWDYVCLRPRDPGTPVTYARSRLTFRLSDGRRGHLIQPLEEIDGFQILPPAITVWNPFAAFARIVAVEHGGNGVDA